MHVIIQEVECLVEEVTTPVSSESGGSIILIIPIPNNDT